MGITNFAFQFCLITEDNRPVPFPRRADKRFLPVNHSSLRLVLLKDGNSGIIREKRDFFRKNRRRFVIFS